VPRQRRLLLDELRLGLLPLHRREPATGRRAVTGEVQSTALAGTGVQAEALSKAALLSGARRARGWLGDGGVIVYDDATFEVIEPRALAREAIS